MKVLLPFVVKDIGGTATFATKFSAALRDSGIRLVNQFCLDFDTLFIMVDCPLWMAVVAKVLRKRIVQRLDGVYHPATPYGRWYWLYNLKMRMIHNYLADYVIYQSRFSQLSCETFLGKRSKNYTIVYNGVDTDSIRPVIHGNKGHIRLVTFAKFRRRDQIEPLLSAVKLLDSNDYSLDIYGAYTPNLAPLFSSLPSHIAFKGKVSNKELLTRLGAYDLFLFSDQSACPNSVIEALAAGLPVVAYARGSIEELVKSGYNGAIVPLGVHDPFRESYPFAPPDYEAFAHKILDVVPHLKEYQSHARRSAEATYRLSVMVDHYIAILRKNI